MAKDERPQTHQDLTRLAAHRHADEPPRPDIHEGDGRSPPGRAPPSVPRRIIRRRQVIDRLGIGQSTLYDWIKRGEFPRPIPLGSKLVGWPEDVVDAWLAARAAEVEE